MSDRNPANMHKIRAQREAAARTEAQRRQTVVESRLGFLDASGTPVSPTLETAEVSPERRRKIRKVPRWMRR